jgi:predicted permease
MFWRRRRERDLDRELHDHLALEAEERNSQAEACATLGNLALIKEDVREAWGWMWLDRLAQDLRFAFRTLRKSPAFAVTAVLSLALGIGASTAIFSLIDALLLRWLPVRSPQELVQLTIAGVPRANPPLMENFSYPLVKALETRREIFAGLCGFTGGRFPVGANDSVEETPGAWVAGAFYETLGLQPAAGRLLTRDDDHLGATPAAVISDGYWNRRFGRDPRIIGQSIPIFGKPVTIVGVSPAGFSGANVGQVADITLPLAVLPQVQPDEPYMIDAGSWWIRVVARPQPGIGRGQLQARLNTIWPQLAEAAIPANMDDGFRRIRGTTIELRPGGTGWTDLRRQFRQPLYVLMALTGLVLLIACANVANLLLARTTARQKEIAMRFALGASRPRIIRQMLTESLLLALTGAALGVVLASLSTRFLLQLLSSGQSRSIALDVAPNWHVLGAATAAAIASAVLFGLVSSRARTRKRRSAAPLLVVAQVAFSLILLIGAGLFVRTLQNLRGLDPGFQREGVLLVSVDGSKLGYRDARLARFYGELLQQIETLPGVESGSFSAITPLSGGGISSRITIGGKPIDQPQTELIPISARYFETMRTTVLLGREFTSRDEATAPKVAIVNQAFAARYLPEGHPLDQRLGVGSQRTAHEIVGVVQDSIYESLREAPPPTVYVPMLQRIGRGSVVYEVRARGSLAQMASNLRAKLKPMAPNVPVEVHSFDAQVERMLVEERLMATLAASFGFLGLMLAVIGLYGLLAYTVARRTSEIGIRMALGANRRRVVAMVMKQAAALVVAGLVIGVPCALALTKLAQSLLFGLSLLDPATFAAAGLALAGVGAFASFLPARRASKVDPMTALRCE